MEGKKYYYQILMSSHKNDKLYYWIRQDKIEYTTELELINFVKNTVLKPFYKSGNSVYVMEVTEEYFNEVDSWYIKNSKPRDYSIFYDK